MTVNIQLEQKELPAFLACLGLGTLVALQKGPLSAEVGVWTMGAPRVWEPLAKRNVVPQEVIEVFQQSDELAALQKLAPDSYEEELASLINKLIRALNEIEEPVWRLQWKWDEKEKRTIRLDRSRKSTRLKKMVAA